VSQDFPDGTVPRQARRFVRQSEEAPAGCELVHHDNETVCTVWGELDMSALPMLEAAVEDHSFSRSVRLGLRRATFMDSVAIRWSLRLVARGQRDGATVSMVVAPGGQPHRVLEVCGLSPLSAGRRRRFGLTRLP